jgi:hypothetical protein
MWIVTQLASNNKEQQKWETLIGCQMHQNDQFQKDENIFLDSFYVKIKCILRKK